MVFIQSQEYTDAFGKRSKNVLCLEGQTDYKLSLNEESGKYEVRIIIGDYEKYIFTADTEAQCTKILQNIFNHHASKDPSTIYDVNAFMIPEVEEETIVWKFNEHYKTGDLQIKEARDYPELNITSGVPIYEQFIENPDTFLFVSKPSLATSVWQAMDQSFE